ncbi:hypothetical protein GDO81_021708 [Engystomops pustulosus]|uniref:Uncharacterized protein n=1 Tax=Engystomops pustulosus TaxID=76066 RepID=A0AAV6ZIS2_ENGPU|nr:hypothetical protein GDO81_020389 [Engystomops pustulosus]KAG8549295.1 hypothetical protein GDO81_021708 [Engystomops pustulosus]KAG8549296.1 hypothetical protein GDO81_021708 [Engystomops pustulosus]KAG8549297.1 hypothetical protein GDO81_021708 [Engystomops pustulosus]KAG8549298.1 hypothetical protein GDO81_021708 [Engystomops pustulosus]
MKSGKLDVVVTSRAAECNALWIINHLRSQVYRDLLGRVTYLPITNRNQEEWSCEVQNHSFSILYHSKHQGRINLTDVTDSLYDLELQELSKTLGRGNVMVVVDDLQKSDEEEKQRILKNQPSISRWASQLLLFAENEKNPISTQKQQVLLQTFQTAYKRNHHQQQHNTLKKVILAAAIGCLTFFVAKRLYRKKGTF